MKVTDGHVRRAIDIHEHEIKLTLALEKVMRAPCLITSMDLI